MNELGTLVMLEDETVPVDTEGVYGFKTVPIVGAGLTVGSGEVAEGPSPLPQNHEVAVVRGHGGFAVRRMPGEAFRWTSSLEASGGMSYPPRSPAPRGEKEGGARW